MTHQFLAIPAASATAERVFSFSFLTPLRPARIFEFLLQGTLEAIMRAKWGSPIIPFGRGDLHITHLNFVTKSPFCKCYRIYGCS
jgi:hypothetical protein